MLADKYVPPKPEGEIPGACNIPDMGIWHPLAPSMFEDVKEYLNWYNSRKDIPADLKDP